MKQNYFIYNGNRYESGTIIILSRFDYITIKVCNTKAKFLWRDTETKEYNVEICGKQYLYKENIFYNDILRVCDSRDQAVKTKQKVEQSYTFSDELRIDSLLIAWVWYVFIMCVGVIFYARIGIWIFTSIIFFNYRDKKLKEAGYK